MAGALIIATHAAVSLEHDVAAAAMIRQRAFAASEHALWSTVAGWSVEHFSLATGGSARIAVAAGNDSATVTVVRASDEIFWLVADAEVAAGPRVGRRRTAISVRASRDSLGVRVEPVPRSWIALH